MCVCVCVCVCVCPPGVCDGGEGYRVTAQMVLVCCWRSMKEVAMMLGELCQSLPLQYNHADGAHSGLVTEEQVRNSCPTRAVQLEIACPGHTPK